MNLSPTLTSDTLEILAIVTSLMMAAWTLTRRMERSSADGPEQTDLGKSQLQPRLKIALCGLLAILIARETFQPAQESHTTGMASVNASAPAPHSDDTAGVGACRNTAVSRIEPRHNQNPVD